MSIRRQAALVLSCLLLLIGLNIVAYVWLHQGVDRASSLMARNGEIHQLSRRVVGVATMTDAHFTRPLLYFAAVRHEIDPEMDRWWSFVPSKLFSAQGQHDLELLVLNLDTDWNTFRLAYGAMRDTLPGGPEARQAVARVERTGGDLEASIVALNFRLSEHVDRMVKQIVVISGAVGVFNIACFVLLFYWLSRRILQPLGLITDGAKRLSGGDFSVQVPIHTQDEVGLLARAFNQAARDLQGLMGRVSRDKEVLENAERALQASNRTYRIISACNQALVHAADERRLLESVCRHVAEIGGYPAVYVSRVVEGQESLELIAMAGISSESVRSWEQGEKEDLSHAVIRRRVPMLVRNLPGDPNQDLWPMAASEAGFSASLAFPLEHRGRVYGALRIFSRESLAFQPDEVQLLKELAADLSFGVFSLANRRDLSLRTRAIESSRNAIIISEVNPAHDYPIVYANPAITSISGYSIDEVIGHNARFLIGNSDWRQPEVDKLREALRRRTEVEVILRNTRKDGSPFWNELSLSPVRDSQGQVTHYVSVINDVTDRIHYQEELKKQATQDALTGLVNRVVVMDRVDQAVAHANRSQKALAVLYINLDRFKVVNDTLGREAGDEVVRTVALRLSQCVRREDTVGRVDGDEFIVLLADLDEASLVRIVAHKIRDVISAPIRIGESEAFIGCSIGISVAPNDGDDAVTLMRNAEVAMYASKQAGGDGFHFFTAEMNAQTADRLALEAELRQAILRGNELVPYFQPKVSAEDGRIVGAEALIRWRHPTRGLVPPFSFIPLAEETGLIVPIGEFMIRESLRLIRTWTDSGLTPVPVSVNLSPRQFSGTDIAQRIAILIAEEGVPAHLLEMELTEGMLVNRVEEAVQMLKKIKATGVSLSIDDFGTGYSSLSYLQRFPIDTLKVDRSFVKDLPHSQGSIAISQTVITLARSLGMDVIAEGVETLEQQETLLRQGCSKIQGFLYSPPVPPEQFANYLAAGVLMPKTG